MLDYSYKKEGIMARVISLKYAAVCADCSAPLPVGASAKYYGPGRVYGRDCHTKERLHETRDGRPLSVSTFKTSGGTFTQCNCEDYPCCGH